jgi:hypothetical protein
MLALSPTFSCTLYGHTCTVITLQMYYLKHPKMAAPLKAPIEAYRA